MLMTENRTRIMHFRSASKTMMLAPHPPQRWFLYDNYGPRESLLTRLRGQDV